MSSSTTRRGSPRPGWPFRHPVSLLTRAARPIIGATAFTAIARPRTIHDFRGFPPALSLFNCPAPGLPELAGEIAEWVKPTWDEAVELQMTDDPASILRTTEHPDCAAAIPTPDHFMPLLYTAGLAAQDGPAWALVRGYAMGSLSMTCYGVGIEHDRPMPADGAALIGPDAAADRRKA